MASAPSPPGDVTRLLHGVRQGDRDALERLLPLVYADLRGIAAKHMRGERDDHTLTPTAVVHEVFLRLAGGAPLDAGDTAHFLRAASRIMRRVLVDHARARHALKREGGFRITLDEGLVGSRPDDGVDFLGLDLALEELAAAEPRWAQVVELRFFAGLEVTETAAVLGLSPATVKRDWQFARAWLAQRLPGASGR